ncbi:MAG TPA: 4'-phosphopantetheinyl transferase superfamily protein [Candidatus Sulfotelmatobacter sp.]
MKVSIRVNVGDCGEPGDYVVPELESDVVQVWTRSLQVAPHLELACYELLSSEERERAARYRVGGPRSDFVLTRGTLRWLAASYLATTPQELSFRYSSYGKPFLDGASELRFNVSHTDGLALMAFVKAREVGIDVEKIRPVPELRQLTERFFSVHERQSLHPLCGEELCSAFFRCWTRKEAYVKARGEGLSLPLHQFDVSIAASSSKALLATRPDSSEAERWMLSDLTAQPAYAAALAVANTANATPIEYRDRNLGAVK